MWKSDDESDSLNYSNASNGVSISTYYSSCCCLHRSCILLTLLTCHCKFHFVMTITDDLKFLSLSFPNVLNSLIVYLSVSSIQVHYQFRYHPRSSKSPGFQTSITSMLKTSRRRRRRRSSELPSKGASRKNSSARTLSPYDFRVSFSLAGPVTPPLRPSCCSRVIARRFKTIKPIPQREDGRSDLTGSG